MCNPSSLADQLLQECEAMAHYAFTSGIKIPNPVIQMMNLCEVVPPKGAEKTDKTADEIRKKMPSSSSLTRNVSLKEIAVLHGAFARIVSPATPRTILLIHEQGPQGNFGSVPLVRKFMLAAFLFLIGWVFISLSPMIDGTLDWEHEKGIRLLLEELFILFAAGIGACFSILFQVNRFVVRGTYDPKYDSTYWTRLVLGLVAGMILAFMIPLNPSGSLKALTKPTLALLGGFSVTVVYRIMMRLVAAVESLVRGDTADIIEAQVKAAQAESDAAQTEDRMRLSTSLMGLREKIDSDQNKDDLKTTVDQILNQLMPRAGVGENRAQTS
jgi:hypothetical protein